MSMTFWRALAIGAMAAWVTACGSDNGGDVLDGGPPRADAAPDDGGTDCMNPTFTDIHAKILRNVQCTACHETGVGLGGLTFAADKAASYTTVMGDSLNGTTPPKRVVPNDPAASSFYLKLTDNPPFGLRMPQGGRLTTCEINAVEQWILNGANND